MAVPGLDEAERKQAEDDSRATMERLSLRLKDMILSLPPRELLGYIWSTAAVGAMLAEDGDEAKHRAELNTRQFVLEYVHAALASFAPGGESTFNEAVCAEIFEVAEQLRSATLRYCLYFSLGFQDGVFGGQTSQLAQTVLLNWVQIRGNRYSVLEEEFYAFVLAPHEDELRQAYDIGSAEIATGLQALIDTMAGGYADAADQMDALMEAAAKAKTELGITHDQVQELWKREQPDKLTAAESIFADIFHGGICNVSKHTRLPPELLRDLAFERGEHQEFFAPGLLCGTPLRTLPARMRPLVNLAGEYFATDSAFIRDSSYRALLWNLVQRRPEYKVQFEAHQKEMSETAFWRVLQRQLLGATVRREICYRHPLTGQWVENDLLIQIDDVLIIVEAKAGAAATIASPATDFERHSRAIRDLIIKAYEQCRRFLEYLSSQEEVGLYVHEAGRYVEVARVRLSDYRVVLPIGLTVESFAPYSVYSKQFRGIEPILGRYPFVSLSIDDLFVLRRFLPTTDELIHYFEVRQTVGGIREVLLFDEMDHLGAYLTKNRFDFIVKEQLAEGPDRIYWDGQSDPVDKYFSEGDPGDPPKRQAYPEEGQKLLAALDSTREKGWLAATSHIRNFADEGRESFAAMLSQVRFSLSHQVSRYFQFGQEPPLFVWMHRTGGIPDLRTVRTKACIAAMAAGASRTIAVLAYVTPSGEYSRAIAVDIDIPAKGTAQFEALISEVERMQNRMVSIQDGIDREREIGRAQMPRPNEPCWCGSGKKFKHCHRA